MSGLNRILREISTRSLWQVTGLYVAGSWLVLQVADVFVQQLFLPAWVFRGVLVLLAIGLPILLATSYLHGGARNPAGVVAEDPHPGRASVARRLFTWRRALSGGLAAFALLGLGTGGYLASRALGIGPAATLVDTGALEARGRVLVAEFASPTGDSALANLASESLRLDLAQSSMIRVADPLTVTGALERMERPRETVLDLELATELAIREGIQAIVTGSVNVVGGRSVIAAEVIAVDGTQLAAHRETANGEDEFVDAIDRLSARLRERIGEGLGSIRADPPLERATTSSLEALRLYTQATRMIDFQARNAQAIPLLEEAVRTDTLFGLAWRKLARAQENIGYPLRVRLPAYTRAFELRDRLTTRERLLAEATYHDAVTRDLEQALVAYEAMLELDPEDFYALTNGSQQLLRLDQPERGEEWAARAVAIEPRNRFAYQPLAVAQVRQGRFDEAARTFDAMAAAVPGVRDLDILGARLAFARGDYDDAERRYREIRDDDPSVPGNHFWLERMARFRGRVAEAERFANDGLAAQATRVSVRYPIRSLALRLANLDAVVRQDPGAGARRLDRANSQESILLTDDVGTSFLGLARIYGAAGRSEDARVYIDATIRNVPPERLNETAVMEAEVRVLWGEGRYDEAVELARRAEGVPCPDRCWLTARAYFRAGQADSAIAYMERAVSIPWLVEDSDTWYRPLFYERLGRLYDERGDLEKAAEYYAKFVEIWADADEELQPRVRAARLRVEEILAIRG